MTNGLGRLGEPDEIGYGVLFFRLRRVQFLLGSDVVHAWRARARGCMSTRLV